MVNCGKIKIKRVGGIRMHQEVRKGITQAKFNDKAFNVIGAEIFVLAVAAGYLTHSWIVFGVLFIGLLISFQIRKVAIILSVILSIGWGFVAWKVAAIFGISIAGLIVISILATLIGGGYHRASIEYVEDL